MSGRYVAHCIIAGCNAAGAGISAKLLTTEILPVTPLVNTIICISCIALCNVFMWVNYTIAMQGMRTVTATSCTTTANVLTSAVAGYVLFGDVMSLSWFCGISFIIIGIILVNFDQSQKVEVEEKEEEKDKAE